MTAENVNSHSFWDHQKKVELGLAVSQGYCTAMNILLVVVLISLFFIIIDPVFMYVTGTTFVALVVFLLAGDDIVEFFLKRFDVRFKRQA